MVRIMGIVNDIERTLAEKGIGILDPWIGSTQTKREITAVLLSGRNLLLEGPPGTGKTLLAKAIARSLPDIEANDCSFNCDPSAPLCPQCRSGDARAVTITGEDRFVRIQGSPEITAEDLVGDIDPVLAFKFGAFDRRAFSPGKITKANRKVLFVDEINRLPEKMQNTLLQVLQEGEMTIGNFDIDCRIDTVLIATMNGRDIAGIESLSEALKDRLERVAIPYPTREEEQRILKRYGKGMLDVPDDVRDKIVTLCQMTRTEEEIEFPASPRSALAVYELSQGFAKLRNSQSVGLEDLSSAVTVAFLGRLSPSMESSFFNKTEDLVRGLLERVLGRGQ